jgi:hypothetical protein
MHFCTLGSHALSCCVHGATRDGCLFLYKMMAIRRSKQTKATPTLATMTVVLSEPAMPELSTSQSSPSNPSLQLQVYRFMPSSHTPSFWQGKDIHSFVSNDTEILSNSLQCQISSELTYQYHKILLHTRQYIHIRIRQLGQYKYHCFDKDLKYIDLRQRRQLTNTSHRINNTKKTTSTRTIEKHCALWT